MPIHVECGECFSGFDVSEKYAGRHVRCRSCGQPVRVPQAPRFEAEDEDDADDYNLAAQTESFPESAQLSDAAALPPRITKRKQARKSRSLPALPSLSASPWLFVGGAILLLLLWAPLTSPFTANEVMGRATWAFLAFLLCGTIALWRVAYEEGFLQVLVSFFLPPFYLVYSLFTNFRKTLVPLALYATGTAVFAAGFAFWVLTIDHLNVRVARQEWGIGNDALGDPGEPYNLNRYTPTPPKFDESGFQKKSERGFDVFTHTKPPPKRFGGRKSSRTGEQMQYRVYLPAGVHAEHSLGCVLVPPAGTNLMQGSRIDSGTRNPEHIPYINAGYAVVTFSLDGWIDKPEKATEDEHGWASLEFQFAYAGLLNARAAFDFAANDLPAVDPRHIYIAGHSSAGTLALLFAEHEPRLAGCLAYAPQTDVEAHLRPVFEDIEDAELKQYEFIKVFATRSSPKTHAARLSCPVFIYQAAGDTVVSAASTRAFCDQLRADRKDLTYLEGAGDDHYHSMIVEGIPAGLKWLADRPGSRSKPPPQIAARPADDLNSLPAIKPPTHVAPRIDAPPPDLNPLRRSRRPALSAAPSTAVSPPPTGPGFADTPRPPAATHPDVTAASPPSESRSPPAGTRPVRSAADLTVGMRIIAFHGGRWVGAEVVEVRAPDRAKVHYLKLPEAFDRIHPLADLHIPLAARELSDDLVETLSFEILRITGSGSPDPAAIERKLLELEGYLPGTLQLDVPGKTASVQVVRGSRAEKDAHFGLSRGKVIVRSRPSRNR